MKYWDVPYEITNRTDFHEFVQSRAVLFDDYPFLVIKPESAELTKLKDTVISVKVGISYLKQKDNGHFSFTFEEQSRKKKFLSNWCEERKKLDKNAAEQTQIAYEQKLWRSNLIQSDYGSDNPADCLLPTPLWDLKTINLCSDEFKNPLNLLEEAKDVNGIIKPYAYYGYPNSSFPLHREDLDLCSVNYLHQGEPKIWYGFRAKDNERIIQYLRTSYSVEYATCEEAFRHKNFFLNLEKLQEYFPDLKIFRVIQEPGHFVLTGPAVFHQGCNQGYNIAEAVNFAIPAWKPFLKDTSSCYCIAKSWKVAPSILHKLSGSSQEIRLNSSVFRYVRSSKFLVIAETQAYQKVQNSLKTLRLDTITSEWIGLEPIPDESVKTFSIYSLRLFQVTCGKPVLLPAVKKKKIYISKKQKLANDKVNTRLYNENDDGDQEKEFAEGNKQINELEIAKTKFHNDKKTIPKSKFTTLNQLHKSFSELLRDCFILPFTTGKIVLSDSEWSDTFQLKWSILERICLEYQWHEVFRNLLKPKHSSPLEGRREFFTFEQIQENFSLEESQEEHYFSLSLKAQLHNNSIEVAVADNNGHVRLNTTLKSTKSSKQEFWENFKLLTYSFDCYCLIIPSMRLVKNLLLLPTVVEEKVKAYHEMTAFFPYNEDESFIQSIFSLRKNHNYFKYLELEDIDACGLARLQFYKIRGTRLSFDELKFTEKFCSIPRRKALLFEFHWEGKISMGALCD